MFRFLGAFNTAPEFCGFALNERFEPILLPLREIREELGHSQISLLPEPQQLSLRRLQQHVGALDGEMQCLKAIDTEHVPRSAQVCVQASDS
jgi:hypothetical protein